MSAEAETKVRFVVPEWIRIRVAATALCVFAALVLAWLTIFWLASLGETWDQNPATAEWVACRPNETPAETATYALQLLLMICLGFVSVGFVIMAVAAANGAFEEKETT